MIYDPRDVLDDLVLLRQRIHRLPNAERDMMNVFAMAKPDIYVQGSLGDDELAAMQTPALVFVSEHNSMFFKKTATVIDELAPNTQLVALSGVAHWSQFETSDYFNETAIGFLNA